MAENVGAQIDGISALAEPARRALYLYVAAQPEPVSREQAAEGVGLPRHVAKFHLDRLVAEGLLSTEFRRLTGRTGPGAGRPSKLYRRSDRQLTVTLPERHYELAGHILAQAVDEAAREKIPVLDAVRRAATAAGHRLGARSRTSVTEQTDPDESAPALAAVAAALAAAGYEPRLGRDRVELANCPFHTLAREHTELVCAMNVDLIEALLAELESNDLTAVLNPAPDRCCVTVNRLVS